MKIYRVMYINIEDNKKYSMNAYGLNKKEAVNKVREIVKNPISILKVNNKTHNIVLILNSFYFLLYGMKFIKQLGLIFLAVDVTLRYHINGLERKGELIAIFLIVFGLYGFMELGIRITKKEIERLESILEK